MYLSSPRVNIAEESVEDHRVQLQCKFDEMEGKYTEAKPRCTCPSYESNLHQVGEVQHLLPLDLTYSSSDIISVNIECEILCLLEVHC